MLSMRFTFALVRPILRISTAAALRRRCRIAFDQRSLHRRSLISSTRLPSASAFSPLNDAGVVVTTDRSGLTRHPVSRVEKDAADSIAIAAAQQRRRRRRQRAEKAAIISPSATDWQREVVLSVSPSSPVPATHAAAAAAAAAASSSPSAHSAPSASRSPSVSPPDLSVKSLDPDFRYATDEDSTRASLLAFAELEGKMRAKRNSSSSSSTAPPPLRQPSPPSAVPTPPSDATSASDATVSAAGLDAFAALELQLAKKRLDAKRGYLSDPLASTRAASALESRDRGETVLAPPRLPEANECCGMSCPNCVWIVYAEQLAEYEAHKQQRQRQSQT